MCGIVGSIGIDDNGRHWCAGWPTSFATAARTVTASTSPGRVALGMRRLSIIDVAGGDQPIYNEDRTDRRSSSTARSTITRTCALSWRRAGTGSRRTPTPRSIVHLYEDHGDACVDHLRGMFAFALHDMRRDRVLIARDRLGKKPVYYHRAERAAAVRLGDQGAARMSASAARAGSCWRRCLPDAALQPRAGKHVRRRLKLPAAHRMVWEKGAVSIERYWDPFRASEMDTSGATIPRSSASRRSSRSRYGCG